MTEKITNTQLEQLFKDRNDVHDAQVTGDEYHYQLTIIADLFTNKSKIARQQWVYKLLNEHIISGRLHAITIQAWTVLEWETQRG